MSRKLRDAELQEAEKHLASIQAAVVKFRRLGSQATDTDVSHLLFDFRIAQFNLALLGTIDFEERQKIKDRRDKELQAAAESRLAEEKPPDPPPRPRPGKQLVPTSPENPEFWWDKT